MQALQSLRPSGRLAKSQAVDNVTSHLVINVKCQFRHEMKISSAAVWETLLSSIYSSIYIPFFLPFIIHLSRKLSTHPPTLLSIQPFTHLSIHQFYSSFLPLFLSPIHPFIHPLIHHLTIHLPFYPPMHLFIHPSVYPFIHLFLIHWIYARLCGWYKDDKQMVPTLKELLV